MGATPLGIPYPEGGDSPAGHMQMRALAESVDGLLANAAGPWRAWQPNATGATFQSSVARYIQIGKAVHCRFRGIIAGVTADVGFVPPVPMNTSGYIWHGVGVGTLVGPNTYTAFVYANGNGSKLQIRYPGTNGLAMTLTPTAPFTWVPGTHAIAWTATYEAA